MILYYAIGGGFGHVTRAQRVLRALAVSGAVTIVCTRRPPAAEHHGVEFIEVPGRLEGDRQAHAAWVAELLEAMRCERIFIDVFPSGIQGELATLSFAPAVELNYVARLLRWDEREPYAAPPSRRFDCTYRVEELTPEHDAFVSRHSVTVRNLDLLDPAFSSDRRGALPGVRPGSDTYWLIVHSGPEWEVDQLIAHARDVRAIEHPDVPVLVATPLPGVMLPDGFVHASAAPRSLYAKAEKIISAAGFNVMSETACFADRHLIIPFDRRFDDQFTRAARRRAAIMQS